MQDKDRDKLINELNELRQRVSSLEQQLADDRKPQRDERNEFSTAIQFIGDFGLVKAKGLDLSDGGVGFEVEEDIPFDMEFEYKGQTHQHRANLVWMRRLPNGCSRFGFQFLEASPSGLLWLYRELKEPAEQQNY
ncbi:MAG: PilZ domain-containing protein [Candidatus Latescibacterota bacterium]|jgi:hypothetical protein